MKKLHSTIIINTTPENAWNILSNPKSYPDWNPFITHVKGDFTEGKIITATMALPHKKPMSFKPKVTKVVPNSELRWIGKVAGIPGVFTGEHYFIIEKISDLQTKFTQGENCSGILVPFLSSVLRETENAFGLMNQALKNRAESN